MDPRLSQVLIVFGFGAWLVSVIGLASMVWIQVARHRYTSCIVAFTFFALILVSGVHVATEFG